MYGNHKIIFIDQKKEKDNFFCKLCGFPLTSHKDFNFSKKYNSCFDCYLKFIECRKEDWENGWRPEQSEIKKYITNKKKIIINKS